MEENIDNDSVSDEILEKAQKELHDFIAANNIPGPQKMMLIAQEYMFMVMVGDHKKVSRMYPDFQMREKRRVWWEKVQWIFIPIVVVGLSGFVMQFIYFWVNVVPRLNELP